MMDTGLWVWLYPLPHSPEPILDDLAVLGVAGVIPQEGTGAINWARRYATECAARGLECVVGLGVVRADLILAALDVPGTAGVMIDWEGAWEGHGPLADSIASAVLAAHPDAASRVVDCPWWVPLTTPQGHATHPHAPTREFGRLCGRRFVQAYGADVPRALDGASARMLAWSRDPSQYPALGTPADRVRPALQMYRRSVRDQVQMLLDELETGAVALWDWHEADAACKVALQVVHTLRGHGLTGPDAVRAWQAGAGLQVDGVPGALTCASLGLQVPAGVRW